MGSFIEYNGPLDEFCLLANEAERKEAYLFVIKWQMWDVAAEIREIKIFLVKLDEIIYT